MKTYSEHAGKEPFNWRIALSVPDISDYEWAKLSTRSQSWTTCACGNQCYIIPRRTDNAAPIDKVLSLLGGNEGFHGAIKDKNAKLALVFLDMIEKRSSELIQEIVPVYSKSLRQRVIDLDKKTRQDSKDMTARHRFERAELKKEAVIAKKKLDDEIETFRKRFGDL